MKTLPLVAGILSAAVSFGINRKKSRDPGYAEALISLGGGALTYLMVDTMTSPKFSERKNNSTRKLKRK